MSTFKVPLPDIVYERPRRQHQEGKRGWREIIFYIRAINDQRPFYDGKIKASNRLYKLGVWDNQEHNKDNLPYEWAFSTEEDQVAMFEVVLKNIVGFDERKKFVMRILKTISDAGLQARLI